MSDNTPRNPIAVSIREQDAATLTCYRAQDFARATYNGYGGWVYALHWREEHGLDRYRDEAKRALAQMRKDAEDLRLRIEATAALADLLDCAIDEQA